MINKLISVRKPCYRVGAVAWATCCLISPGIYAATERQLDAHEHGHAQINMAISGQEVLAELITPAANVVGFEHMPKSDEDKHAIHEATEALSRGEQLFIFNSAAQCSLLSAEIESELLGDGHHEHHHEDHDGDKHHDDHADEEKHDDHDHDEHGKEGHDDHHDHDEKHDDHDHDGAEKHHDHDGHKEEHDHEGHADDDVHSEFHVTWSFNCADPDKLDSLQVNLFDTFPGFEEIDMSVAGESAQSSFELSPDQIEIRL